MLTNSVQRTLTTSRANLMFNAIWVLSILVSYRVTLRRPEGYLCSLSYHSTSLRGNNVLPLLGINPRVPLTCRAYSPQVWLIMLGHLAKTVNQGLSDFFLNLLMFSIIYPSYLQISVVSGYLRYINISPRHAFPLSPNSSLSVPLSH